MQKIILHPEARMEMLDAAAYYEDASAGLGYALLAELETVFATINDCPDRRQILKTPYRRALL